MSVTDAISKSHFVETDLGLVPASEASKWQLLIHYMEPILKYYKDPQITEIMVNRYDDIMVEGKDGIKKVDAVFNDENSLVTLIKVMSTALNQDAEKLDILDARFPDQSRACCTMQSVTPKGSTVTIRCAPKQTLTFDQLVEYGTLTYEMKEYISDRVMLGDNIVVSGSTASGKTTFLRAIAEFIPKGERVIVCEDTQELFLDIDNLVMMEAPKRKDSNLDLSELIKTTLRKRPDRVYVGEIRDARACDAFLQVINTGHHGCCTSIHANSPEMAIKRIQYLLSKEGLLSYELAENEIKSSVDLFVQTTKTTHGKRVTDISRMENGELVQVYSYDVEKDAHSKN